MKKPIINEIKQQTNNKYLNLFELNGVNSKDKPFKYFVASRNESVEDYKKSLTEEKNDAVCMCGVDKEGNIVLIRQWRYPVNDYVYEFPSGLIDKDESAEEAAIREYHEETGLIFHPLTITNGFYPSCGLTNERLVVVMGTVEGKISNKYQEDNEDIEVLKIHKSEILHILDKKVGLACALTLLSLV